MRGSSSPSISDRNQASNFWRARCRAGHVHGYQSLTLMRRDGAHPPGSGLFSSPAGIVLKLNVHERNAHEVNAHGVNPHGVNPHAVTTCHSPKSVARLAGPSSSPHLARMNLPSSGGSTSRTSNAPGTALKASTHPPPATRWSLTGQVLNGAARIFGHLGKPLGPKGQMHDAV